jgi:hypothetical protein
MAKRTRRRKPAPVAKQRKQYVCLAEFVAGHKRYYPDQVLTLWDAHAAILNKDVELVRLVV